MSNETEKSRSQARGGWRRSALWFIFGLILMIPKINRLRRHRTGWNFGRIVVAIAGVLMATVGGRQHSAGMIIYGVIVILLALLVTPEATEISTDARARELGALIVVDGGEYLPAKGEAVRAKLFVGAEHFWVLDRGQNVIAEFAINPDSEVVLESSGEDWNLVIHSGGGSAEFRYRGNFAEHLARVAESTIRSRVRRELPIVQ